MRQGPNARRPRGRTNRKHHGGGQRPNSYDSNGPDGRIRGNAHQVFERYVALARDAVSAGDRISAETHYQHAEHYFRIMNASTDPRPNGQERSAPQGANGQADGEEPFAQAQPPAQPSTAAPARPSAASPAPNQAGTDKAAKSKPVPKKAADDKAETDPVST